MRANPFLLHVVNYKITKLSNVTHSAVKGSHIPASKPLRTTKRLQ